jgi:hypothetical protein
MYHYYFLESSLGGGLDFNRLISLSFSINLSLVSSTNLSLASINLSLVSSTNLSVASSKATLRSLSFSFNSNSFFNSASKVYTPQL